MSPSNRQRPAGARSGPTRPPRVPHWGLVAVCLGLAWLSVVPLAPAAEGPPGAGEPLIYPMVFPLLGDHTLTDSFGDPRGGGRSHAGIDIMAERMVPVVAVADGTVRWVHNERGKNCCDVALLHDDGWRSRYIHLNNDTPGTDDGRAVGIAPGVVKGARVTAGQVIGWVGDSGNAESTAPHLHFELRRPDGRPVDALASLRAARARARELGSPQREGRVVTAEPGPRDETDATGGGTAEERDEERDEEERRGFWRRLLRDPDEGIPPAPPMSEDEGEPTEPVEEEEAVQVPRPPLDEEVAVADHPAGAYPDLGMERRVEQLEWDGAEGEAPVRRGPSGGGSGERSGGGLGCYGFAGGGEEGVGAGDGEEG